MDMLDLIKQYKKRLESNPNDFDCLFFALQIPSICSRIEFPKTPENTGKGVGKLYRQDGSPYDKNMYKKWLKKHDTSFFDIYCLSMSADAFRDVVYDLRCQVTHEGILMTDSSRFYFTNDDIVMCIGSIVFLPIMHLCKVMFDTAITMLLNICKKVSVTPFEDVFLADSMYSKIRNDFGMLYKSFWDNHFADDRLLNCIYDHIIFYKPDIKSEIDEFFKNQPNGIFEIWDFGVKCGGIIDAEHKFIKQKYDENKSKLSQRLKAKSDVLCLSKMDYERMLQVHKELETFSEMHPFDIIQYAKKD